MVETLNPNPLNTIHRLVILKYQLHRRWVRCCASLQTEELRATVETLNPQP